MIHSMTGFGEATAEEGGQVYHVELRSFNQRYLKTTLHLPDDFAFLESDVDHLLRQRLARGSVTLRLHVRDVGPPVTIVLNSAAVQAYVTQLRAAAGDDPRVSIDLAALLTLPGVCQTRELTDTERERRWGLLAKLTNEALERLTAMRAREGEALAADLGIHCDIIARSLEAIRHRAPVVLTEYRDRLHARVEELIAGSNVRLAAEDLLKEVSIYAERSDISEELSRLAGHVTQFRALMAATEPAGRKLEFIAQEMLREANTIGSKAADAEITRAVVEIKTAVDRIKEQVQNVE